MRPERLLAAIAAALGLLALASPAAALDGECLWNNVETSKRAAAIESYRTGGARGVQAPSLGDDELRAVVANCGVNEQNAELAGMLIAAITFEKGAAAILQERFNVSPAALERAWESIGKAAQDAAGIYMIGIVEGQSADPKPFDDAVSQLMAAMKLPDNARQDVVAFVTGRSSRQKLQTR